MMHLQDGYQHVPDRTVDAATGLPLTVHAWVPA